MAFGLADVPVWFHSSMPAKDPAMLTAPRRLKSMLGKVVVDADASGTAAVTRRAARRRRDVDADVCLCGRCRCDVAAEAEEEEANIAAGSVMTDW